MTGWRARAIAGEAGRNALTGGFRSVLVATAVALGVAGAATADLATVQAIVRRDRADLAAGSNLLRVSALDGDATVSAPGCEALNRQAGVVAAGALVSTGLTAPATAPGNAVRLVTATAGFLAATRLTGPADPAAPGVLVGRGLADELSLRPGAVLRVDGTGSGPADLRVDALAAGSSLLPELDRAVVVVVPPAGDAGRCYVATTTGANGRLRGGDVLGLADLGLRLQVTDLLPRGTGLTPSAEYAHRATRDAWMAGSGLALLTVAGCLAARRPEWALHRALGSTRVETAALAFVECVLLAAVGVAVGALAVAAAAAFTDAWREPVEHAVVAGARVAATVVVGSLPLAFVAARSRGVMDGLKDR